MSGGWRASAGAAPTEPGLAGPSRPYPVLIFLVVLAVVSCDVYPEAAPADPGSESPLFVTVTDGRLDGDGGASRGVGWADFDSDGDPDLVVSNTNGQWNAFYRNTPDGFRKESDPNVSPFGAVPAAAGNAEGVAWVDVDGDGDLDLHLVTRGREPDLLFENRGEEGLVRITEGPLVRAASRSMGCWADVDGDGWLDVFLVGYGDGGRNALFRNLGDWRFEELELPPEVVGTGAARACSWGDPDDDGLPDLYVANGREPNVLLRNRGAFRLEPDAGAGHAVEHVGYSYGLSWADFDDDGHLDLFVANWGSADQVNRLYRNTTSETTGRSWIGFRLRAEGTKTHAWGAKVRAKAVIQDEPRWMTRWNLPTTGYASQNQLLVHFGLDDAEQMGLREGDRILRMNGALMDDPSTFARERQRLKGGDTLLLTILRDGETLEREAVLPPLPRESLPGVEIEYGSALSPRGYRVQTIVTKPEDAGGPLPGVFFVRWMSCSPVERPVGPRIGIDLFLRELATRSGAAMMRVEKPGLGDSEGPPCRDVDFRSELDAHRAAFRAFRARPDVDPERIVVVAQSNGAAYAPLVVEDAEVAGYAVTGGWVKSWFEHMMEIERRRFALMGHAPGEVNRRMGLVAEFYTEFLIRNRMPGEILRERPHREEIWAWGERHQYGLPAAYLQQLQALNLEEVWRRVDVPTLVFWGEYDWAMSREDHVRIAELVNRNGADLARFVEVPGMHHSLFFFDSLQQGFDDFSSGTWDPSVVYLVLEWLEEVTAEGEAGPDHSQDGDGGW